MVIDCTSGINLYLVKIKYYTIKIDEIHALLPILIIVT